MDGRILNSPNHDDPDLHLGGCHWALLTLAYQIGGRLVAVYSNPAGRHWGAQNPVDLAPNGCRLGVQNSALSLQHDPAQSPQYAAVEVSVDSFYLQPTVVHQALLPMVGYTTGALRYLAYSTLTLHQSSVVPLAVRLWTNFL